MEHLIKAAIRSFWRASHGLTPLPPLPAYDVELRDAQIVVTAGDVRVEGALTALYSVAEQLLWQSGWSALYDVRKGHICDLVLLDTYEGLADCLMGLLEIDLDLAPRTQIALLALLADAEVEEARERLAHYDSDLVRSVVPYDDDTLVDKLFAGRKNASTLELLRNACRLFDDDRALVRRQMALQAADLVAQTDDADPYQLCDDAASLLDRALADTEPTVREGAAVLLDHVAFYAVEKGAFDRAGPLLDQAVTASTSFALQHARRWKVRLAQGNITGAAQDWSMFSQAVERLVAQIPQHGELSRALTFYRVDGLLTAAEAALCHSTGWPTERARRQRCKQPTVPGRRQRELFESIRVESAREALDTLEQLVPAAERKHTIVPSQLTLHGLRTGNIEPIFSQLRSLAML